MICRCWRKERDSFLYRKLLLDFGAGNNVMDSLSAGRFGPTMYIKDLYIRNFDQNNDFDGVLGHFPSVAFLQVGFGSQEEEGVENDGITLNERALSSVKVLELYNFALINDQNLYSIIRKFPDLTSLVIHFSKKHPSKVKNISKEAMVESVTFSNELKQYTIHFEGCNITSVLKHTLSSMKEINNADYIITFNVERERQEELTLSNNKIRIYLPIRYVKPSAAIKDVLFKSGTLGIIGSQQRYVLKQQDTGDIFDLWGSKANTVYVRYCSIKSSLLASNSYPTIGNLDLREITFENTSNINTLLNNLPNLNKLLFMDCSFEDLSTGSSEIYISQPGHSVKSLSFYNANRPIVYGEDEVGTDETNYSNPFIPRRDIYISIWLGKQDIKSYIYDVDGEHSGHVDRPVFNSNLTEAKKYNAVYLVFKLTFESLDAFDIQLQQHEQQIQLNSF